MSCRPSTPVCTPEFVRREDVGTVAGESPLPGRVRPALGEVSRLTAGFTTVYGPHMVEPLDVPKGSLLINGNPLV